MIKAIIKHIVKLQDNRAYRYDKREIVVEGIKIVQELKSVKTLFVTEKAFTPKVRADEIIEVSEVVMKKISRTKNPEGVAALIDMPPFSNLESETKVLALDSINDPGNLGTLIRTAAAFGWGGIYLLEDCCDPYNEKALRAAKGSTFKISLAQGSLEDFLLFIEKNPLQILIGELSGIPPEKVKPAEKRLLILGNEANGVSQELSTLGQNVALPMTETTESLNVAVAGGILMYLL